MTTTTTTDWAARARELMATGMRQAATAARLMREGATADEATDAIWRAATGKAAPDFDPTTARGRRNARAWEGAADAHDEER